MADRIDVTPGAHRHTEARGTVSFKLACGCYKPHGADGVIFEFKTVGCEYPCSEHGDQVITKATTRLTGWTPRRS